MTEADQANRVVHLDGLRGIAILTVFLVHWAGDLPVFTGGYIGVDVFFVLSGYIITTLLVRRRPTYGRFMLDRFRRLYPPLLGLLTIGTLIVALWPRGAISISDAGRDAAIAGLQISSPWLAGGHSDLNAYTITWSLAVEWYFYLAWPLVVALLARASLARAARWCAILGVGLYFLSLAQSPDWFYFGPIARFGEMALGAALAFWTLDGRTLPSGLLRSVAWTAPVFFGTWTIFGTGVDSWGYRLGAFPLTVLCTVVLIAAGNAVGDRHPMVALLEWRPLVWVGTISYTLYLWHTLPIALIPGDWYGLSRPALGAIGLLLVATTTWLGFVFLEKPFRHRRGAELRPNAAAT